MKAVCGASRRGLLSSNGRDAGRAFIMSFSVLPVLNVGEVDGRIATASPVLGSHPILAGRLPAPKVPKPVTARPTFRDRHQAARLPCGARRRRTSLDRRRMPRARSCRRRRLTTVDRWRGHLRGPLAHRSSQTCLPDARITGRKDILGHAPDSDVGPLGARTSRLKSGSTTTTGPPGAGGQFTASSVAS